MVRQIYLFMTIDIVMMGNILLTGIFFQLFKMESCHHCLAVQRAMEV